MILRYNAEYSIDCPNGVVGTSKDGYETVPIKIGSYACTKACPHFFSRDVGSLSVICKFGDEHRRLVKTDTNITRVW